MTFEKTNFEIEHRWVQMTVEKTNFEIEHSWTIFKYVDETLKLVPK